LCGWLSALLFVVAGEALNVGADRAELVLDALVAAVDVIDAVDHRSVVGNERRQYQARAGAEVARRHRRTAEMRGAFDDGKVAVDFDIGAHVQQGQLMAEIDTPEVDEQLQQARADLETAQANLAIAKITADRWQGLVQDGSVSQQETDQALSNLKAVQATVQSNAANVRRLEQLQSFEKVYAPFDGIITARQTDIGALIDAGASTQPRELFHMAAIRTLRVYVAVPEVYSPSVRSGGSAALTLDEFPGETFRGTIVRNANAIDLASRTLLVEVDIDNATGRLLPGAYVFVHLKLPDQTRSLVVSSNTLIFRKEGLQVGLVRDGKAVLVPVKIGHDFGNTVEIISGLQPTDAVIIDPSDSLVDGMPVRVSDKPAGGFGR